MRLPKSALLVVFSLSLNGWGARVETSNQDVLEMGEAQCEYVGNRFEVSSEESKEGEQVASLRIALDSSRGVRVRYIDKLGQTWTFNSDKQPQAVCNLSFKQNGAISTEVALDCSDLTMDAGSKLSLKTLTEHPLICNQKVEKKGAGFVARDFPRFVR